MSRIAVFIILLLVSTARLNAQDEFFLGTSQNDKLYSILACHDSYFLLGTGRRTANAVAQSTLVVTEKSMNIKTYKFLGEMYQKTGCDLLSTKSSIYTIGYGWKPGTGRNNVVLSKLTTNGRLIWEKQYGYSHDEFGLSGIICDDGGIAVAGFTKSFEPYGNVYLLKTDAEGNKEWDANFGGPFVDYGFSVAENPKGELLVAGTEGGFFLSTRADFKNHDSQILLLKIGADGQLLWEKSIGGNGHDWARHVIAHPNGGFLLCGATQEGQHRGFDMFLMRIDDEGNEKWTQTYGDDVTNMAEHLSVSSDGNIYLAGTSLTGEWGTKAAFTVVKTDGMGELIWNKTISCDNNSYATDIISTPDSGCIVAGYSDAGEYGKSDMLLYKINAAGQTEKLTQYFNDNDQIISLSVYPVPVVNEQLFVEVQTLKNNIFSFSIYDAKGSLCFSEELKSNVKTVFHPRLAAGTYIYVLEKQGKRFPSGKLIIK